jgi:hypothetical protein
MSTPESDMRALVGELTEAADALAKLVDDPKTFRAAREAFREGERATVGSILDKLELRPFCQLLCGWFCSKECVLRCIEICGPPPRELAGVPDVREFADAVIRLSETKGALERFVEAVEGGDRKAMAAILKELELERFCHLLCHWICFLRCSLRCELVCGPRRRPSDLVRAARSTAEALRVLVSKPEAFEAASKAVLSDDCPRLRGIIGDLDLAKSCQLICLWFCSWRCILRCLHLCRGIPLGKFDASDDEVIAFARAVVELRGQPEVLKRLVATVQRQDAGAFAALLEELKLTRFCIQLCHWLCFLLCRRFCICVCPPLVAEIDDPVAGACVEATPVPICTGPSGPLVGIQVVGTAGGGGFDHYTLHYSWGANPPVEDAVVYPDCGRPPGTTSSSVPVSSGILGYLDVTLLPPGITQFTVYLDVFDSGAGHLSKTTNFEIKTVAVEVRKVAKVTAFDAEDPFNLGNFTKLIKDPIDPSPTAPEQSIGGSFTADGSAYVVGCNRILSQFFLARFDAPATATVPTPATGSDPGATAIIAPVAYGDIPGHPWQSGCIGAITPNVILNGDLVAVWSTDSCVFLGVPYTVPKVEGVNWDSSALNGRFVIFLEVDDRALPGGAFPGTLAAKDQVVVWIDNRSPIALITSIGGVAGCGDLHLKDYKGTTAEIRGVAWDPPIDPTAPQQRPNDNFGSYSVDYKKDGELATFPIVTAGTRVPNVWPGPPPPPPDGTLANWDIVSALDYTGPAPTPPGKLARGDRCAFVISLSVVDTTHVGDSGNHHTAGPFTYAINVINDL